MPCVEKFNTMSIWQNCQGDDWVTTIKTPVFRIVESQEQVATMSLVDNSSEQSILEDLLEARKPQLTASSRGYHYLIKTPFRYPPLRYGSRFGKTAEPGLFYASLQLKTALSECAYYRLVFLEGMQFLPEKHIVTEHTTFKVNIDTDKGLALEKMPFAQFTNHISDPVNYIISQQLGTDMRASEIVAFTYNSARDQENGINTGIFKIHTIKSKKPYGYQEWICSTEYSGVTFVNKLERTTRYRFNLEEFKIDDKLPHPAT